MAPTKGTQTGEAHLEGADLYYEIAAARQVITPGVAHLPNMEKPEVLNRQVLAFLHEVSLSA